MAEIKWIKLNVDMFDDEKLKIIQSMPEGDALLVVWIKLLTLAGKTNDGGYIYISDNIPYTEETLAIIMNKPLLTIRLAIDAFTHLQMIDTDTRGIYLVNFEKHQSLEKMEKIKEQNRLRKQRERERKKLMSHDVTHDVTQSHATDIDKDIDKDLDKEKDKEKDINEPQKRFVKPTLEEVQAYCKERNNNVDAKAFFDYYETGDWKDAKGKPVKNWKQKVITWERSSNNGKTKPKPAIDYDQFTE